MMVIGAILVILAVTPFVVWPIAKKLTMRAASAQLHERTKTLVDRDARLQAEWTQAMEDGVLTEDEARAILEKAGEKVEPEK
jgi:hypothetical protein